MWIEVKKGDLKGYQEIVNIRNKIHDMWGIQRIFDISYIEHFFTKKGFYAFYNKNENYEMVIYGKEYPLDSTCLFQSTNPFCYFRNGRKVSMDTPEKENSTFNMQIGFLLNFSIEVTNKIIDIVRNMSYEKYRMRRTLGSHVILTRIKRMASDIKVSYTPNKHYIIFKLV